MIFRTNKIKSLIYSKLRGVKLNKPRYTFFVEIMLLFFSIKDKMNFSQFGRYINCDSNYPANKDTDNNLKNLMIL